MSQLPAARRGDQVDDYHGEQVADPYRWLEATDDPEAQQWAKEQSELTEEFLARAQGRDAIRARLTEIWDFPSYGVPFVRGERWFQLRNSGLQDQSVLYVMASPEDQGEVLLDPNTFSGDGTVSVPVISVSHDGELLAYALSRAGSDWMTWHVREVKSGHDLADVVEWSKYGDAVWRKDGSGFYYSATDRPEPGKEYTGQVGLVRVFFHPLGRAQNEDELVFGTPGQPEWIPEVALSDDGRFLVISISVGTAPETRLEVLDLERPALGLRPLVSDFSCLAHVIANVDETFFILTDDQAERRRLVRAELATPGKENWEEVLAEREAVLIGARNCGGRLLCLYLEDACSRLSVFELDGTWVRDLPLPAVSSVPLDYRGAWAEGSPEHDVVHFETRSFTDSGTLWSHDARSGATKVLRHATARIAPEDFVTEEAFVTADDGARLPLFLVHRRDVVPDGDVPTLLYGYGGFNIPVTPDFHKAELVFVERGGLYAVAVLRGGGEYGRSWHDAGRLAHKQRVFDDFCDCARWLVSSGWSRPARIAINGRSNGGLLVGACLTQHPELFGAAVPEVGVMDMLRFHKFTIGWAWKSDFGDPDQPEQYQWVRGYSPLHNVEPGLAYPPTLVTTGDHDDRVVPGHSFKFAAALQAAAAAVPSRPEPTVLVRVDISAGHGFGKPTSKTIAERADVLAFLDQTIGR